MNLLGIVLVMIGASIGIREKLKSQSQGLKILLELQILIDRIRIEIGCYLTPIEKITSEVDLPILSELGFFESAAELGLESAYKLISDKLCASREVRHLLSRFFSMIGKGYANDEIKLIDSTANELLSMIKRESESEPSRKKLTVTLATASALGIIILLI